MLVVPGATSISVDVQFLDDTGAAVTGQLATNFPVCKWSGGANAASTAITLSDLSLITTAHPSDNTAGGIKEREGGWYRLDCPNNMFTSAGRKTLTFAETTNKRIIAPTLDVQYAAANVSQLLGTAWLAPGTAGTPDVNAKLWNSLATVALPLVPATPGRTLVVDAAGLADANAVKVGPTGSGTAQTARDIGASVLLSSGTGTGQLDFTSGVVKGNVTQWLGFAVGTPNASGTPDVNVKTWNNLPTIALPLIPTTAGRTLDVSLTGEAGVDWANVGSPTNANALTGTTIGGIAGTTQTFDALQTAINSTHGAGSWANVTVSDKTGFSLVNGAIVTATFGTCDFTSAMKTSLNAATPASVQNIVAQTADIGTRIGTNLVMTSGKIWALDDSGNSLTTQISGVKSDTATILTDVNTGAGAIYTRIGVPSGASIAADIAAEKVDTAAIKLKTDNLPASPAAVGSAMTLVNGAIVTATFGTCDFTSTMKSSITSAVPTAAAITTAVLTTQMTESYNADGVAPTLAQSQFVTMQRVVEFSIVGASIVVHKLDGTTQAFVLTTDSATNPTASTRSA